MSGQPETVVAEPPGTWTFARSVFPVAGAAVAYLLKVAAGWVAGLPAAPMQWVFQLVSGTPEPWASGAALVLGAAVGLGVALYAQHDSLTVTVTPQLVTLARGGSTTEVARDQISAAFLEGKQLVLLGRDGRELARQGCDHSAQRLAVVFTSHGLAWHPDGDPYLDRYRRWVPDTPEVSAAADALFKARQKALDDDDADDAADLRAELAKHGLVVRDRDKRQYWRELSG